MVDGELGDRMNIDEPMAVGADDIVSTKLELCTAADPIAGPIVLTLELDPTRLAEVLPAKPGV